MKNGGRRHCTEGDTHDDELCVRERRERKRHIAHEKKTQKVVDDAPPGTFDVRQKQSSESNEHAVAFRCPRGRGT